MGGPAKGNKGRQAWQASWEQKRPSHRAVPQRTARSRPVFGQHTPSSAHGLVPRVSRPSVRPTSASAYGSRPAQFEQEEESHHEWAQHGGAEDWQEDRQDEEEEVEYVEESRQCGWEHDDQKAEKDATVQADAGSWKPEPEDNTTNSYADEASALLKSIFAAGPFIGVLQMLNERKGYGFISPLLSELPSEFAAGANGLWFFGNHQLPEQEDSLGKHVQFSIRLAENGKPQAVDVIPADPDAVADACIEESDNHRCQSGHTLQQFVTEQTGYGCNICEREFPAHTTMFACRLCNVDKCEECYHKVFARSETLDEALDDGWNRARSQPGSQASASAAPKAPAPSQTNTPGVPSKQTPPESNFNKVLVVSTLPLAWTIMDVEQYFVRFGSVDSVFMLPNHERTCCVIFTTIQGALKASARTKALIHGTGQGMMGCLTMQHFPGLSPDMKRVIEAAIDEFAPSLKEDVKSQPPPKFAMQQRLIGTVSSTIVSGMRVISSSKLPSGTAAFDPKAAPEDALEGATVAFAVDDNSKHHVDGHVIAVVLEVLSRPSPENASLLARAAAASAPGNAAATEASHKRDDHKGKDVNLKCFPCKEAVKLGRCSDEANCPYAHTLAEVLPLADTKVVHRIAKKRFGKPSLLPMAGPSMLPMPAPRPMAFGMMPPVWGMNPFLASMGIPPMVSLSEKKKKKNKKKKKETLNEHPDDIRHRGNGGRQAARASGGRDRKRNRSHGRDRQRDREGDVRGDRFRGRTGGNHSFTSDRHRCDYISEYEYYSEDEFQDEERTRSSFTSLPMERFDRQPWFGVGSRR